MLIIAGVHFTWNVGSLQSFGPTVVFHIMESTKLINNWLSDTNTRFSDHCMRLIATVCLAEVCEVPE